jgi:hypothetical protein
MLDQHRSHILSTYTTALQHIAEIREVAVDGRSPAGGRVTPLPEPQRSELLKLLDMLARKLENMVRAAVPDWDHVKNETGGLSATKMWINVLLRTVEELLAEAHPDRMTRAYGAMSQECAQDLREEVDDVLATLREGMSLLG